MANNDSYTILASFKGKDAALCAWDTQRIRYTLKPKRMQTQNVEGELFAIKQYKDSILAVNRSTKDAGLILWHLSQQPVIMASTHSKHSQTLTALEITPDGAYVIAGTQGGTLIIWDAHTGDLVRQTAQLFTSPVAAVTASNYGNIAAGASSEIVVMALSTLLGEGDATHRVDRISSASNLVNIHWVSATGFVASFRHGPVQLFSVGGTSRSAVRSFDVPDLSCSAAGVDGVIYTGSTDGTVNRLSIHTGQRTRVDRPSSEQTAAAVRSICISRDGTQLAVVRSGVHMISVLDGTAKSMDASLRTDAPTSAIFIDWTKSDDILYTPPSPITGAVIFRSQQTGVPQTSRALGVSLLAPSDAPAPAPTARVVAEMTANAAGNTLKALSVADLAALTVAVATIDDLPEGKRPTVKRKTIATTWTSHLPEHASALTAVLGAPMTDGIFRQTVPELAAAAVAGPYTKDAAALLARLAVVQARSIDSLRTLVPATVTACLGAGRAALDSLDMGSDAAELALSLPTVDPNGRLGAEPLTVSCSSPLLPWDLLERVLREPLPAPIIAGRFVQLESFDLPTTEIIAAAQDALAASRNATADLATVDAIRAAALRCLTAMAERGALLQFPETVTKTLCGVLSNPRSDSSVVSAAMDLATNLFASPATSPLALTRPVDDDVVNVNLLNTLVGVVAARLGATVQVDGYEITATDPDALAITDRLAAAHALAALLDRTAPFLSQRVREGLFKGLVKLCCGLSDRFHTAVAVPGGPRRSVPVITTAMLGLARGGKGGKAAVPDRMTLAALVSHTRTPELRLALLESLVTLLEAFRGGVTLVKALLAELSVMPGVQAPACGLMARVESAEAAEAIAMSDTVFVAVPVPVEIVDRTAPRPPRPPPQSSRPSPSRRPPSQWRPLSRLPRPPNPRPRPSGGRRPLPPRRELRSQRPRTATPMGISTSTSYK
ncbi:Trp-Asp (WD) repeats circular [Carpediemonas membranifera]|uniref:Trp-Asp (WD) repeats circular n=1 Tax=Carpediemonas membranifera TaxID=201153 RepID=A0A8J6E4H0_9EUKA|nr:Trp-Asp (WD) repeats circular [Carpediemonas membranifera]|eukprot:KAG9394447.1 Trp-Asp (WD) repeats circular [Carpediemonas membranifera]